MMSVIVDPAGKREISLGDLADNENILNFTDPVIRVVVTVR